MTCLTVGHLPQIRLLFWQLGYLIVLFCRGLLSSRFQIILRLMFFKIPNAKLMYFPVLCLYGECFRNSSSRLTGCCGISARRVFVRLWVSGCSACWCLTWVETRYSDTHFCILDIAQTWSEVEKEIGPQFKFNRTFLSSTGSSRLSVKPWGSCQSKGHRLTTSCQASCYHSFHLR